MVSFGDIEIAWLVSKDTSISKDVVDKNFVDKPSQVYELTADLEAGTYSAILNENVQAKNESFEVQQDAVLSMVIRHGSEFPFKSSGDDGYILVESASVNTFPSLEIREGELQVRFLDQSDYNGAVRVFPVGHRGGEFDATADPVESLIAFPTDINVVNETEDHQITAADGNISFYLASNNKVFEYEEDSTSRTLSQTQSICRLFNSSGERIYSDKRVVDNGSNMTNEVVDTTFNASSATFDYYNGSSWVTVGSTQLPFDDGYTPSNKNIKTSVEAINGNRASIYRGFPMIEYEFSRENSFDFDPSNTFSEVNVVNYYGHWQDGSSRDIVVVRTSTDGSFYTGSDMFGIQNLTSANEYTVFVGVVPGPIAVSDYARYLYNLGLRRKSFVQNHPSETGGFGTLFGSNFGT